MQEAVTPSERYELLNQITEKRILSVQAIKVFFLAKEKSYESLLVQNWQK